MEGISVTLLLQLIGFAFASSLVESNMLSAQPAVQVGFDEAYQRVLLQQAKTREPDAKPSKRQLGPEAVVRTTELRHSLVATCTVRMSDGDGLLQDDAAWLSQEVVAPCKPVESTDNVSIGAALFHLMTRYMFGLTMKELDAFLSTCAFAHFAVTIDKASANILLLQKWCAYIKACCFAQNLQVIVAIHVTLCALHRSNGMLLKVTKRLGLTSVLKNISNLSGQRRVRKQMVSAATSYLRAELEWPAVPAPESAVDDGLRHRLGIMLRKRPPGVFGGPDDLQDDGGGAWRFTSWCW